MDFAAVLRDDPFGPVDAEGLDFAGGELTIDERPLSEVPEPRLRACLRTAAERHRAAAWLVGAHPVYSRVPPDA